MNEETEKEILKCLNNIAEKLDNLTNIIENSMIENTMNVIKTRKIFEENKNINPEEIIEKIIESEILTTSDIGKEFKKWHRSHQLREKVSELAKLHDNIFFLPLVAKGSPKLIIHTNKVPAKIFANLWRNGMKNNTISLDGIPDEDKALLREWARQKPDKLETTLFYIKYKI